MLTEEQLQDVKLHLLKQLDNFPEDQRKIVKHKILSMNKGEMETFLKENGLDSSKESDSTEDQQCIFCAIAKSKIKSYKILEEEDYVAILELNPLSKGHILIIPKKHLNLEKLPENAIEFAKKVATIVFQKLNPKDIQFQKNEVLEHAALEVIPVYGDEKLEKKRASDEELINLQRELVGSVSDKKIAESKPELPKIEDKKELSAQEAVAVEKKPELPKIKPRIGWL
jgi:histidine triad (HIT) family protein